MLETTEMLRAILVDLFPDATEEGLERATRLLLRWGAEGVGERLTPEHAVALTFELRDITGSDLDVDRVVLPEISRTAPDTFWRAGSVADREKRLESKSTEG